MKVAARHMNARMTPRKVRQLRGVVVGRGVREAQAELSWQPGKAADLVQKVLASAVANAKHNFELEEDNLRVASMEVDDGIRFKRFQPASRGSAHRFVKRSCHIRVVVEEIEESGKQVKPKQTEIETVQVEDLAEVEKEAPAEEVKEAQQAEQAPTKEVASKEATGEAQGKKKMQQAGGDKKTKRSK